MTSTDTTTNAATTAARLPAGADQLGVGRRATLLLVGLYQRQFGLASPTDIARAFGTAPQTATETLGRLHSLGWLVRVPNRGVYLTDAGRAVADDVERRLVVLQEALDLPRDNATAARWATVAAALPDEGLAER